MINHGVPRQRDPVQIKVDFTYTCTLCIFSPVCFVGVMSRDNILLDTYWENYKTVFGVSIQSYYYYLD